MSATASSRTRAGNNSASAPKPVEISAELKSLMRRLKLGQLLSTLPERLAFARQNHLPHHNFLEMLFADEVSRRDRESAQRRARTAHLDPQMHLQAWDDDTVNSRRLLLLLETMVVGVGW